MIAIPQQPQKMTIEEYLEWEPDQDVRYEYVNGELFAFNYALPDPKRRSSATFLLFWRYLIKATFTDMLS
jgi:Uma2 family endonuclease